MPKIPAICEQCGKPVLSPVEIRDETRHLRDASVGTCVCGGTLRMLDGTYSHLGGPLNFSNAQAMDKALFCKIMDELGEDYYCQAGASG